MKKGTKIFVAALALVLVFGAVVGGTLAWLMDETAKLTNTFTIGSVDIDLTEEHSGNVVGQENTFKIVPGATYDKDPMVTVVADSETAFVFIKVEEENNDIGADGKIVKYAVDTNVWTPLVVDETPVANVYYKEVASSASDTPIYILTNNKVEINDELDMNDVAVTPTLSFTAYAVQKANLAKDGEGNSIDGTAAQAWALIEEEYLA